MLTGDMKHVSDKIGKQLGIDEVYSELLPADKVGKLDFYYEPKTVVFIDGEYVHSQEHVSVADEDKRRKLKAKGYRVIVINEATFEEDVRRLLNMIE